MAHLPDFDSLERWQHSIMDETYTEHQKRMANDNTKLDDPNWDIVHGYFDVNELRKQYKLTGRLQETNSPNANRKTANSRFVPDDEILSRIDSTLEGADIKYRREISGNYEGDGNVIFIDCKFQRHVKIAAQNVTIIGNNGSAPKFIEAEENVVVFGHHFITRVDCQRILGVGYDFRVNANVLEENWISSKDDWQYAENLLETYANALNQMLHKHRISYVEIPTAQEIMAYPRSKHKPDSTTIRVNDRDYGESQGSLVKDIATEIIAALFKNGKHPGKKGKNKQLNTQNGNLSG